MTTSIFTIPTGGASVPNGATNGTRKDTAGAQVTGHQPEHSNWQPSNRTSGDQDGMGARTAQIIRFPSRRPANPATAQPNERLARALETLNGAMAEQRAALAAWRAALADLKTSAGGLGDSLTQYRASLASLGHSVSLLQTQAKGLQKWADKAAPTPPLT